MREYSTMESPIGCLYIVKDQEKISALHIGEEAFKEKEERSTIIYSPKDTLLQKTVQQLQEYFQGMRKQFELPLEIKGTDFQKKVWDELVLIAPGQTRSYQDVATNIGKPKAVRAVGQANKANSLPIIIPCHRVIGKNSRLTGYAGKRTDIKEVLLRHEGAHYKQ